MYLVKDIYDFVQNFSFRDLVVVALAIILKFVTSLFKL